MAGQRRSSITVGVGIAPERPADFPLDDRG